MESYNFYQLETHPARISSLMGRTILLFHDFVKVF